MCFYPHRIGYSQKNVSCRLCCKVTLIQHAHFSPLEIYYANITSIYGYDVSMAVRKAIEKQRIKTFIAKSTRCKIYPMHIA